MARILLVDDDDLLLSLLMDVLEKTGHECIGAESVYKARNILAQERFDVVLSDFNMPGENGLDLLCYVRRRLPCTAFILMTASAERGTKEKASALGVDGYLRKPFSTRVLEEVIQKVTAEFYTAAVGDAWKKPPAILSLFSLNSMNLEEAAMVGNL